MLETKEVLDVIDYLKILVEQAAQQKEEVTEYIQENQAARLMNAPQKDVRITINISELEDLKELAKKVDGSFYTVKEETRVESNPSHAEGYSLIYKGRTAFSHDDVLDTRPLYDFLHEEFNITRDDIVRENWGLWNETVDPDTFRMYGARTQDLDVLDIMSLAANLTRQVKNAKVMFWKTEYHPVEKVFLSRADAEAYIAKHPDKEMVCDVAGSMIDPETRAAFKILNSIIEEVTE